MRKKLKKLGISILATAIIVTSIPVTPILARAETDTAQEETAAEPEESSAAPEETKEEPEESSAAPEETKEESEESSAASEETKEESEESSAAPEETKEAPEESSAAPEETKEEPEESSAAPEETKEKPEDEGKLLFTSKKFVQKADGSIVISLRDKEISGGNYCIQISAAGNSRGYQVLADGKAVMTIFRENPEMEGEQSEHQLNDSISEDIVSLAGDEKLVIKPLQGWMNEDEELTGEIVSVELLETDEEFLIPDGQDEIVLYSEDWYPVGSREANLAKGQWIDFMILERDGFEAGDYLLTAKTTGERAKYQIKVNGETVGQLKKDDDHAGSEDDTEARCEAPLSLEPGDIVTVYAGSDGHGFAEEVRFRNKDTLQMMAAMLMNGEGIYTFEAEDYYTRQAGIETDGEVTFCDIQPGEEIRIAVDDRSLAAGYYELSLSSNGNRTGYAIYVNDVPVGVVKRGQSGWGAADLTEDAYEGIIYLELGDEIRVKAPLNKWEDDNGLFGKLDSVTLTASDEIPPDPVPQDEIVLNSEDWYFGKPDDTGGVNLRPNDQIDYFILPEHGFSTEPEVYQMAVQAGGFRTEYVIKVNGSEIGKLTRPETGWGELNVTAVQAELTLKTGDVLSICAGESWGTVGEIVLNKQESGGYIFEAEDYYTQQAGIETDGEVTFCDIQPGEEIRIAVNDRSLAAGYYELSLSSNGNRTGYAIYVNDVPVGVVKRGQSGWGAADLTTDRYKGIIYLEPGDEIRVKAPLNKWEDDNGLFGKLDSVTLIASDEILPDPVPQDEIVLNSEDWYFGKPDDTGGVNLRPNDQIDYFILPEDGFSTEPEVYQMTVQAGGFRTEYVIKANGSEIGKLTRPETGWGELNVTTLKTEVTLKAGDILSICAGESWGTVGEISLNRLTALEPFEAIDPESGIVVSAAPGRVPAGSNLVISNPQADELEEYCTLYGLDRERSSFYRISLTDNDGNEITPLGKLRIQLPVDEARQAAVAVCLITPDGKMRILSAETDQGYLTMETEELGIFGITEQAVKDIYTYEAEDYFVRQDGIQSDGGVTFCDIQPGETVTFQLSDNGLEAGWYRLAVVSNGTRTAYAVDLNDTFQGVIKRTETGWDAASLTRDAGTWVMDLSGNDTITVTASTNKNDGDGDSFGKIDCIILIPDAAPEIPSDREEIVFHAEDWYGGTKDGSGGMNVRPDDQIDLAIREQDGFAEGDYILAVRAGGYRTGYRILVNGKDVMTLAVRNTDWGAYLNATAKTAIHLVPGDVVTLYADESWGCIETITFYKDAGLLNHSMEARTGGRMTPVSDAMSSGAKASGQEPVYYYQGEGYYRKQADHPAADLQPGEQIEIPLADNPEFADGLYQVTVVSCGARDHLFVKVNGQKTGRIDRTPGQYGMAHMTRDQLSQTVFLRRGDLLCIEAAAAEWGWVDYIRLELVQKAEVQSEISRYQYKAMDYYGKKQADTDTADLQPGEKIEIPLPEEAFEAGYYYVSATSCGERKRMSVEVNGETAGWIYRNSNAYGMSSLVRDTMSIPVYLKPGDRVALCAPRDSGWAWVGTIDLMKAE